jgi:hypothetical protein
MLVNVRHMRLEKVNKVRHDMHADNIYLGLRKKGKYSSLVHEVCFFGFHVADPFGIGHVLHQMEY